MLRWLTRVFAGSGQEKSGPGARTPIGIDDAGYSANSDIVDGMKFSATLQIRTRLDVLEKHGEVFKGPPSKVPAYGGQADGIWLFHTPGPLSEMLSKGATHASDVGSVDPEAYLPFLKAFRRIVESQAPLEEQLSALMELPKRSAEFASFWKTLQTNYPDFPHSFYYMELTRIEGVGRTTAKRLYEAGLRSMAEVVQASDERLLGIKGIGKSLVAKIRTASLPQG